MAKRSQRKVVNLQSYNDEKLKANIKQIRTKPIYDTPQKLDRMVREIFRETYKAIQKAMPASFGRTYDMEGRAFDKRVTTTIKYMTEAKARFADKYSDVCIEEEVTYLQSAPVASYDIIDFEKRITVGAAIWMLDELKRTGILHDAIKKFTHDEEELDKARMPDITDASHSDEIIRSMVYIIQQRNADGHQNCERYLIDNTALGIQNKSKQQRDAQPDEGEKYNVRASFDAIMALISPTRKELAAKRFEDKQWEFMDLYLQCANYYADTGEKVSIALDKLIEEHAAIERKRQVRLAERDALARPGSPVMIQPRALSPVAAPIQRFGLFDPSRQLDEDDREIEMMMQCAQKALRMHQDYEKTSEAQKRLRLDATLAATHTFSYTEKHHNKQIAEILARFTVDDPFEMCFALLYLLDIGSDLPWLYNQGVAVIEAACALLPWAKSLSDADDSDWDEEDDWQDDDIDVDEPCVAGNCENAEKDGDNEDGDNDEDDNKAADALTPQLVDTSKQIAELYRSRYSEAVLFDDLAEANRLELGHMNLPQIVFELTGMIMPRNVEDFIKEKETLIASGIESTRADDIILYLQLAWAVQHQSKNWARLFHLPWFETAGDDSDDEDSITISENEASTDVEMLRSQIKMLKVENEKYRKTLYEAHRETITARNEVESLKQNSKQEHQELADLREYVFNLDHEYENKPTPIPQMDFPYSVQHRIVVFGGHDSWIKAIRPLLDRVRFVDKESMPNSDMIKNADVVWIQANAISHKRYYKIIDVVRTNNIPVRYFGYASAEKCAIQLAEEDMK